MHCTDKLPDLQSLSDKEKIAVLKKERNDAYLSRSHWIRAAHELMYKQDSSLFTQLVNDELCEKCQLEYHND